MITTRQMYEEYIKTQERRLENLLKEKELIERDIEAVKDMLANNPYTDE
jgi:hypothetical protein